MGPVDVQQKGRNPMREIKFRVYRRKRDYDGNLLPGWDHDDNPKIGVHMVDGNAPGFIELDDKTALFDLNQSIVVMANEHRVLAQYTGLEDKNGKEIYEGDIVKYVETVDNWHQQNAARVMSALYERSSEVRQVDNYVHIFPVEYILCYFNPFTGYLPIDPELWEVIGNIYQNPELLYMEDRNDDSAREELANDNDGEGVLIEEER